MRKDILLPGLALAGGALGLGLRQWHIAAAYDPATQLYAPGHPASFLLPALLAGLTLAFILLLRGIPKDKEGISAFHCPTAFFLTLMSASGLLFLAAGVLGLMEGLAQLAEWRAYSNGQLFTYPASLILCAILCFGAAPGIFLLGKSAGRSELSAGLPMLINIPAATALIWLFTSHMTHSTDPILQSYIYSLAAAAALLLTHYYTAALFHGQPHPLRFALSALLGVALGIISLADRPSLFGFALTAALALPALACSYALLRNCFGPPWPSRLQKERMPSGAQSECGDDDDDDDEEDLFP